MADKFMEFLSVKQKSPKCSKTNKKKPFKIVYISNPVKFTASPDQFRAVVQELTGRHSTIVDQSGAYDNVTDFSTVKETGDRSMITTNSEIEHPMSMLDRCHDRASGSSYGDFEAVLEMFGEKTAPELFLSYDSTLFDSYAESGLGLSKFSSWRKLISHSSYHMTKESGVVLWASDQILSDVMLKTFDSH